MEERLKTPAKLTDKQKKFADYIIKLGRSRATEAAILAGYSEKTAAQCAIEYLKKPNVKSYIEERLKTAAEPRERAEAERRLVADGDEVLQFLTATMRGEIKDQFGLDAMLKDRLVAAKELQRIIDITKKDDKDREGKSLGPLVIEPVYGAPAGDEDE